MTWVTEIVRTERPAVTDVFPNGAIDHPAEAARFYEDTIDFRGWALDRTGPPVAIEIERDGSIIAQVQPAIRRRDIAIAFPDVPGAASCGFAVSVDAPTDGSGQLHVSARLSTGDRFPLGVVETRRRWRDPPAGNPLVSIVIPCYNQARFLEDALASVQVQTHTNVETIVIDDGSADAPGEVAARYGVRCIRQDNQGVSRARNAGLRASSASKYIVFLDADDVLVPRALEVNLHAFEDHPDAGFVSGAVINIDAAGKTVPNEEHYAIPSDPDRYRVLLRGNWIFGPSPVMFRRRAVDDVGGFTTGVEPAADYDIFLKIARRLPVYSHTVPIAGYRQHEWNMSGDSAAMLRSHIAVLKKQEAFVRRRPDLVDARKVGFATVRAWYTPLLAAQVADDVRHRRWRRAVTRGLALVRLDPRRALALIGAKQTSSPATEGRR